MAQLDRLFSEQDDDDGPRDESEDERQAKLFK